MTEGPACFWIEELSQNSLALNSISAIKPTRLFFRPKSSETYAKKILPSALFEKGGGEGGGLQIVN